MNLLLFYFKTKIFTVSSMWATIVGSVSIFLISLKGFVMPIYPFVIAVFALTILDMITGVQAAKVRIAKEKKENPNQEPKEKINSRGLFRTMQKILVYLCGILGAHAVFIVFVEDVIPISIGVESPLVYLVSFPMIWTEFKSLDENINTVTGVSFWKYVKGVKPKLPS